MEQCKQAAECKILFVFLNSNNNNNNNMLSQTHPCCILLGDTFLIRGHSLSCTFCDFGFKPQETLTNVLVALLVALLPHFTPERNRHDTRCHSGTGMEGQAGSQRRILYT